jgi:hypothetical protein
LTCPICNKRKAKRFCPARGDSICSICCGTEREVTIDCPSDCVYLVDSRQYDQSRKQIDWSKIPFPEVKFEPQRLSELQSLLILELDRAICQFAAEHRELVDTDALAALTILAETFRTQESGIIYEKPIDYRLQRELYERLKAAVEAIRKKIEESTGVMILHDSDVTRTAIFMAQLCAVQDNGRPKSRAFLDLTRARFPKEEFQKPASNIVLL